MTERKGDAQASKRQRVAAHDDAPLPLPASRLDSLSTDLRRLLLSFQTVVDDARQSRVNKLYQQIVRENPDSSRVNVLVEETIPKLARKPMVDFLSQETGAAKASFVKMEMKVLKGKLLAHLKTKEDKTKFVKHCVLLLSKKEATRQAKLAANKLERARSRAAADEKIAELRRLLTFDALVTGRRRGFPQDVKWQGIDLGDVQLRVVQWVKKELAVEVVLDSGDAHDGTLMRAGTQLTFTQSTPPQGVVPQWQWSRFSYDSVDETYTLYRDQIDIDGDEALVYTRARHAADTDSDSDSGSGSGSGSGAGAGSSAGAAGSRD